MAPVSTKPLQLQLEAVPQTPFRPRPGQHLWPTEKPEQLRTSRALGWYADVSKSASRSTSGSFMATFLASSQAYQRSVRVCFILACVARI